jgi:glutamyl-tRNA synthetase/glutamyl-Q tRNA(Asp) synthetase
MLTRFAPAPTGYLHLGHVVNALHVWGEARARGGGVLLRIEDHDGDRSRPEFEAALLDDLDWLGFAPDVYPTAAFRAGRCEGRQSDRHEIYARAAADLRSRGLLYACRCTRRELGSGRSDHLRQGYGGQEDRPLQRSADVTGGVEIPYPGTCRDLALPFEGDVGWRVRLPPGDVTFVDRWRGLQTQTPAQQCGDLLIRDRRRHWTYQFVATVDDHLQGITDVIRGEDLLASTGRQIVLGELLGRANPAAFAHHRLVMKSLTQKLSKSDGDTGVRELRRGGWSRDDVIAAAKQLIGG